MGGADGMVLYLLVDELLDSRSDHERLHKHVEYAI
jgi:hypothetical protein